MPEDAVSESISSALPNDVRESVAASLFVANSKTVGEMLAAATGLAFNNNVAHLDRLNKLAEAELANSIGLGRIMLSQAVKAVAESDLGEGIAQLSASIAGSQQQQKGAGNTPPVTP